MDMVTKPGIASVPLEGLDGADDDGDYTPFAHADMKKIYTETYKETTFSNPVRRLSLFLWGAVKPR
jgi:hypothetical protein